MTFTLKIEQMSIDGHPYGCPECDSPAFTLDATGFLEALPVWGNCPSSHSWQDPLITQAVLRQIRSSSSGRQRATDADEFAVTTGGAVLAGTLHPQVTVDDVKKAGGVYWRRIIKPAARRRKKKAVRAVTRPVKNAAKAAAGAVTGAANDGVAHAKAAALGAAWDLQAGGSEPDPDYQPEPVNPCAACKGKGHHKIESSIHDATKVRCSVCFGTGEID
ncbi:hypothetical protein ACWGH2_29200 [Streptomyces sp. NPDC054871]